MLANENAFFDTHFWVQQLGLMPVPLRAAPDATWVMLNGAKGNFCLHFPNDNSSNDSDSDPRGVAWSSNVGHHVVATPQKVEIYRWDTKPSALERFSTSSIKQNLDAFYKYLEDTAPSAENSVVTHAIRTFRSLRAAFPAAEQQDGIQALKAFLLLLACGVEGQPEANFKVENWALPAGYEMAREQISTDDWYALYQTLIQQLPREQLRLYLDLTLRHASGQLFQEAHFEAYRTSQLPLDLGLAPAPITIIFENKAAGLHFTPPALVRVIVEEALRLLDKGTAELKIFDPACGSAEFLRETLRQLLLQGYEGKVHLIGWDISPAACDMARFILQREVADWNAFERVEVSIQEGDSLGEDKTWPTDINLVAMNPPFVQWKDMTPDHRIATEHLLAPLLGSSIARQTGNYDLSHVFFVRTAHCLANDGILATILPISVLDSKAAEKVRGHLSELMQAHMIARLGSHSLFSNALVDAAFYIGQNRKTSSPDTSFPLAFWSDYRSNSSSVGFRALRRSHSRSFHSHIDEEIQEDKAGYCFYYQPELGSDANQWLPRPAKAWKLWQSLRSKENSSLVGDVFEIEQGINTGKNEVFILSSQEWNSLPSKERTYFRPTVYGSSLLYGQLSHSTYVFFPYGEKSIENEEQLVKTLRSYYELKLKRAKKELSKRTSVSEDKWWLLNAPRLTRHKQFPKIVSTHFGSAGAYAWDETGKFTVVQGHVWLPRNSAFPLSDNITTDVEDVDIEEFTLSNQDKISFSYLAILNSSLFFDLVSAISHHVSGGQWDLSKRYIDQLPLPNLFDTAASPDLIEELAEIGRIIHRQGLSPEGLSPDALATVARAYGLSLNDI